jgi:hypothetical protein
MTSQRGPYKRYLYDSKIKVPRSTLHLQKKKRLNITEENELNQNYQTSQMNIDEPLSSEFENSSSSSASSEFESNDCASDLETNSSRPDIESKKEKDKNLSLLTRKAYCNEYELAVAMMTLFFKTKMTQTALSLNIKFFNMISTDLKLPANFDSVAKIISKDKQDYICYETKYFCERCQQETRIDQKRKKERVCDICKKKYKINY